MTLNDKNYYYQRAEAELERAQRATSPEAVKIHYTLAGHYLDRVYGDGEGVHSGATGATEPFLLR